MFRFNVFKTQHGYKVDDPYAGEIEIEFEYELGSAWFTKKDLEKMLALFEEYEDETKEK